jgi:hypothetical protein
VSLATLVGKARVREGAMHWGEMDILYKLVAILCVGSFSLHLLSYFVKRIKELLEELKK